MKLIKKLLFILLILSSFKTAQAQSNFTIGTKDSIYSKILGENRELWVYLPEKTSNTKAKYPVVYLLDGEFYFHSFTGIVQHLGDASSNSTIPDMIVVGIINKDRGYDYTPTHDSLSNMKSGRGELFTNFLEQELLPYIDSKYPTAAYRTLVGHSFGGLLTFNTLLKHTKLFNSYIVLDPAMLWDKERLLIESKALLKEKKIQNKNLFLAIAHPINPSLDSLQAIHDTTITSLGFRDIIEQYEILKQNAQNNLNWSYRYYPNETHGTIPLVGAYDGLRFIFRFYKRPTFAVLTDSSANKLANHYKKVSEMMGYTILPPEGLISGLSWRFRLERRYEDGYNFLKVLSVQYPQYANFLYKEMGLMFEEKGDMKKAKEFYSKAAQETK